MIATGPWMGRGRYAQAPSQRCATLDTWGCGKCAYAPSARAPSTSHVRRMWPSLPLDGCASRRRFARAVSSSMSGSRPASHAARRLDDLVGEVVDMDGTIVRP